MSELYLEKGEMFVISTHRVSVDFNLCELMLTSRNLIFINSEQNSVNPWKIPLESILAVNAGKIPTGEPVITLTFIKKPTEREAQPLNLIFTQISGEQRRPERDDWIKNLMEQIVALRQGDLKQEIPMKREEPAVPLHTSSSLRGIEKPLPHKSVIQDEPTIVRLEVIAEKKPETAEVAISRGETPGSAYQTVQEPPLGEPPENSGTSSLMSPDIPKKPEGEEPGVQGTTETTSCQIPETPSGQVVKPEPLNNGAESSISVSSSGLQPFQEGDEGSVNVSPDIPEGGLPDIPLEILDELSKIQISGEDTEVLPKEKGPATVTGRDQPYQSQQKGFSSRALAAAALIIILLILVTIGVLYAFRAGPANNPLVQPSLTREPVIETTFPTPVLTPTPVPVPGKGIWLLVSCPKGFTGNYGRPGNLVPAGGTGQVLYNISSDVPLLEATFQNKDYSGSRLTVEVYYNGSRVLSKSTTAPGGSVNFMIDPTTGEFPRATPTPASWTGLPPGETFRT